MLPLLSDFSFIESLDRDVNELISSLASLVFNSRRAQDGSRLAVLSLMDTLIRRTPAEMILGLRRGDVILTNQELQVTRIDESSIGHDRVVNLRRIFVRIMSDDITEDSMILCQTAPSAVDLVCWWCRWLLGLQDPNASQRQASHELYRASRTAFMAVDVLVRLLYGLNRRRFPHSSAINMWSNEATVYVSMGRIGSRSNEVVKSCLTGMGVLFQSAVTIRQVRAMVTRSSLQNRDLLLSDIASLQPPSDEFLLPSRAELEKSDFWVPPLGPDLCALCGVQHERPAAVPSGFVFCFKCVLDWVQVNQCCPVTRVPCALGQIFKLVP